VCKLKEQGDQMKENENVGARSTHGRDEKQMQNSGRET
jgi:hypothetical protein